MLNRQNVFEVSRDGHALYNGKKWNTSRALRRFLMQHAEEVLVKGTMPAVILSWSDDEGHSLEQLQALHRYAQSVHDDCSERLAEYDGVELQAYVSEEGLGIVSTVYRLKWELATATLAQLRQMVLSVTVLADYMQPFAGDANATALRTCPEYTYRSLPCSIAPDEQLWYVGGEDKKGGSGVLEWCYDEEDAKAVLAAMQKYPARFPDVSASPWLS